MKRKYRILVDARGTQEGFKQHKERGVGRYALNLLKRLPFLTDEIEFTFLVDPLLETEAVRQIPGVAQLEYPSVRHLPSGLRNVATQIGLTKAIKSNSFDFAHFLIDKDAPLSMNGPFCVSILDTIPISAIGLYDSPVQRIKNRLVHSISKKVATRATSIATISEYSKKDIIRHFHVEPEKVRVIYLAPEHTLQSDYEPAVVRQRLDRYGIPASYFLYLGGIDPRKNIAYLLEGYARYAASQAKPVNLVLAGSVSNQKEYPELRKKILELKLQDRVCLPGFVADEDVAILFAGSRAFLFPSLYEGFGLPILEAMSAGTPVITTELTSIPEVAGDAALYIDPYEPESLAQALDAMVLNDQLSRDLIGKGRKQAQKFSWDRTAQETLDLYLETIRNQRK